MKFPDDPRPNRPSEAVVPMINVVFLLLIFFLLTAVIATPPPIDDLQLPSAVGSGSKADQSALYVGRDGELAFGDARGPAALDAAVREGDALDLRVDAALPAADLARILALLREAGVTATRLVTVAR